MNVPMVGRKFEATPLLSSQWKVGMHFAGGLKKNDFVPPTQKHKQTATLSAKTMQFAYSALCPSD